MVGTAFPGNKGLWFSRRLFSRRPAKKNFPEREFPRKKTGAFLEVRFQSGYNNEIEIENQGAKEALIPGVPNAPHYANGR